MVSGASGEKPSLLPLPRTQLAFGKQDVVRIEENPQVRAEWRSLLRNHWESKKSLIPVILAHGGVPHELPPFLRNRRAILATNFDDAIREVPYLIEHPTETVDHTHEQQSKAEWERRRNELKDYALSLKREDGARAEAKTQ